MIPLCGYKLFEVERKESETGKVHGVWGGGQRQQKQRPVTIVRLRHTKSCAICDGEGTNGEISSSSLPLHLGPSDGGGPLPATAAPSVRPTGFSCLTGCRPPISSSRSALGTCSTYVYDTYMTCPGQSRAPDPVFYFSSSIFFFSFSFLFFSFLLQSRSRTTALLEVAGSRCATPPPQPDSRRVVVKHISTHTYIPHGMHGASRNRSTVLRSPNAPRGYDWAYVYLPAGLHITAVHMPFALFFRPQRSEMLRVAPSGCSCVALLTVCGRGAGFLFFFFSRRPALVLLGESVCTSSCSGGLHTLPAGSTICAYLGVCNADGALWTKQGRLRLRRYATPRHVTPCHTPRHTPCHAMPRHATPRRTVHTHVSPPVRSGALQPSRKHLAAARRSVHAERRTYLHTYIPPTCAVCVCVGWSRAIRMRSPHGRVMCSDPIDMDGRGRLRSRSTLRVDGWGIYPSVRLSAWGGGGGGPTARPYIHMNV